VSKFKLIIKCVFWVFAGLMYQALGGLLTYAAGLGLVDGTGVPGTQAPMTVSYMGVILGLTLSLAGVVMPWCEISRNTWLYKFSRDNNLIY
jgi:hypothetical protein